jgi:hypothetical protein
MRAARFVTVAMVVVIAALANVAGVLARTPVDPTSLTPPLKPFRVCWELGPTVQCDTSGDVVIPWEATDELPCGQLYATSHEVSNSTRWYQDGLIVRRAVQERDRGSWSLSPTGSGPTVEFSIDSSWDEHFAIPGDIDSAIRDVRGITVHSAQLGAVLMEAGLYLGADDLTHGLSTGQDPAGIAKLCDLLLG